MLLNVIPNAIAGTLSAVSVFLWETVSTLAGGPTGPAWRWILVEEGLLLALILAGAYLVRRIMGRRMERHVSQWAVAFVATLPFAGIWTWYSLILGQAINLAAHPDEARSIVQMTWSMPLVLSVPFIAMGGVMLQIAVALVIGSMVILVIGHTWAG